MTSTLLLTSAFIIYPVLLVRLNSYVRKKIPDKIQRRDFKKKKEYIIKVIYLLTPLLLFHVELLYLNAGYSFDDVSTVSLVVLFLLQVFLLLNAIISLYRLVEDLKSYDE